MTQHLYKAGDIVVLKDGPFRMVKSAGSCEILAALPESQGSRRYRIRFDTENFDRSISEGDIDVAHSPETGSIKSPSTEGKDPWLKANSVRTGK